MNDPLDDALRAESARPLSPVPPDLCAGVWREIETRRERSYWSRLVPLLEWSELFAERRLAIAAVACALFVGVLPAVLWTRARSERRLARQAMHLDVFSEATARRAASPLVKRD